MLNYFVYKNGLGNFWSRLGTLGGDTGYLYVGFDNEWAEAEGGVLPPTELNGGHKPHPWQQDDLNHIRFVAHDANFNEVMLLTFEETTLRFWRVIGPVVVAPTHVWEAARAIKGSIYDFYFKPEVVDGVPQPLKPFRVLPVRLVAEVPRDTIYTSVDSLASYQYLIRGTCRPLWRAAGPTAAEHHPEVLRKCQERVSRCERVKEELPFAAFVRLYLNELLHRHGKTPNVPNHPRLGDFVVDLESASSVVMATLNPILVETAALAFVQDLGLTPDIGVGKGKDVIDVRARAAGSDGSFNAKIAEDAWATLQALNLKTADGDNTLRDRLLKRGVLDIQCKAADRKADADGVLYFGFKGPGHNGLSSILLNDLAALLATGAWLNLRRFIAMQARILLGEWRSPSAATGDENTAHHHSGVSDAA